MKKEPQSLSEQLKEIYQDKKKDYQDGKYDEDIAKAKSAARSKIHEFFFGRPDQSLFKRLDAFILPFLCFIGLIYWLNTNTTYFGYNAAQTAQLNTAMPAITLVTRAVTPKDEDRLLELTKSSFIFGPSKSDIKLGEISATDDGAWSQSVSNKSDYYVLVKLQANAVTKSSNDDVKDIRYLVVPPRSVMKATGVFMTKGDRLKGYKDTDIEFVKEFDMEQAIKNLKKGLNN